MEGRIKFFKQDKGFGFIIGEDEKDYFFHITGFREQPENVSKDDAVTFDVVENNRGLQAVNIELN